MITEERKKYIKEWKQKNRERVRIRFREWYAKNKKTRPYYPTPPLPPRDNYAGSSGLGRKYEVLASQMLNGSVLADSFHSHFDILWEDKKIDVKMRNLGKSDIYSFSRKPKCQATHYLCFCVKDGDIRYVLLVPSDVYKQGIKVTEKNIYRRYGKYLFTVKEQ